MKTRRSFGAPEAVTVIVMAPSFPPAFRGGGPVRSVHALVTSAPERFRVYVITAGRDMGQPLRGRPRLDHWLWIGRSNVLYSSGKLSKETISALASLRRLEPRLVHFNSFFNPKFTILPLFFRRILFGSRVTYIVAPRGEFGEAALARRSAKKNLYLSLFRFLGIHRGILWHATAAHEVIDIRKVWGPTARVVMRANQTSLPEAAQVPDVKSQSRVELVFLGRMVEHKGLHIVLQALSSVTSPVRLDVYGPTEDLKYERRCRNLTEKLPAFIEISFCGPLEPEQVRGTLSKYDAIVMPTAGENFGHVIAEALSVACPVIATPWTPWTECLSGGGGAIVPDRTEASWAKAIQEFADMGSSGRFQRRTDAKGAYDEWRAEQSGPHLFERIVTEV